MKPLRAFGALLLVFALAAANASAQESDAEIQWLMVIQGEVTEIGDGTLSMTVPSAAIVFTDRPERRAGLVDLAAFAATAWAEDGPFRTDPPNASVIDESSNTIAVVTITDMSVADGIMTLSVTVLEGALPTTGDIIALTVDAVPTTVNPQITD